MEELHRQEAQGIAFDAARKELDLQLFNNA